MPKRPPIHRPAHSKTPEQRRKDVTKRRGTTAQMGYGARWQRASKQFLREQPLCRECGKRKPPVVKPARQVDHIIPHCGDMALFWDRRNWQPLCGSCHSRKTATEDGGFGRKRQ